MPFSEGVNDEEAIVFSNTEAVRTFQVVVKLDNNMRRRDATGAPTGDAEEYSEEITLRWADGSTPTATPTSTPTPTPTPMPQPPALNTSSGTLGLTRNEIQTGQGTVLTVSYALAEGKRATIRYTAGIAMNSACTNVGGGMVSTGDTRAGFFTGNFYGCTAGTSTIQLIANPGGEVLDAESVTISQSSPSTATITASDTSINVGQTTEVTIVYTLAPSVNFAAISFGDHLEREGRCRTSRSTRSAGGDEEPNQGNREITLIYTLYGCSAGTSTIAIRELASRTSLASLNVTVSATDRSTTTPTPTPTPTPVPVPSTANISATTTSLNVGQSTVITFDYDLQGGDDVADIVIPDILGGVNCRAGRQTRDPQTLQGTYYGCSAGTGDMRDPV